MRAGRMDRIVTLRKRVQTANEYGEQVETFEDVGPIWAEKRDLRGSERFASLQTVGQVDTIWRIRHRTDTSSLNELIYGGSTYEIKAVLEIGRKEGLELHTQSRSE